jgi:hypothetical protein
MEKSLIPAPSTVFASGLSDGHATATSSLSRKLSSRRTIAVSAPLQVPVWLANKILMKPPTDIPAALGLGAY